MSNAGKGKGNRVPGMMQNGGVAGPQVPDDLPFPCTIYACSNDIEHNSRCDGNCESYEPSESQIKLQNVAREYARSGMSFVGVPEGIPLNFPGININLVELLCRIITIEELLFPLTGVSREEFDEMYRTTKIDFLQNVLDNNKEAVKRQHVINSLGLVENSGLLGPDGKPIG